MSEITTIQEANVARLREIDPARVFVNAVDPPTQRSCDTDSHHGKGVCYLYAQDSSEVDVLCLDCAITTAEIWLIVGIEYIIIEVAQ
jgi:hypothetical protein